MATGDPVAFGWLRVQHIVCPCNTVSDFPQRCPYHRPWGTAAEQWPTAPLTPGTYRFTPHEPRLSDEDVERIAKRVAELIAPGMNNDRDASSE